MAVPNDIILYHYTFSPYARRITWYLALRGIDYAQCLQPPVIPRPDVNALGINYRRIPLMSIGRDVYCDTRIILQKLEQRFPDGALGATQPDQKAIEQLLEKWCIGGGVFVRASQLIPPEIPLFADPKFVKDRAEFTGRSWDLETVKKNRPEAIAEFRTFFDFLETGFLADGREWILKTEKPSLADIEAVWPFHWLLGLKGALPQDLFSPQEYPKVFAWIGRFNKAVEAAKKSGPKPTTLKGPEATKHIVQAQFVDKTISVDETDPLGLKAGQEVEVWPTDSGFKNRDRGGLVALTSQEVVIATKRQDGGNEIRLHHPRTGFRIQAVGGSKL